MGVMCVLAKPTHEMTSAATGAVWPCNEDGVSLGNLNRHDKFCFETTEARRMVMHFRDTDGKVKPYTYGGRPDMPLYRVKHVNGCLGFPSDMMFDDLFKK